jgi:hypothetical protein
MSSTRQDYDLPKRVPVPARHWALMLGVVALALVLWVVLPDSPIFVAVLVIAVLGAVFLGVSRVLSSRQLSEPPPRRPTTPPSAERG